MGMELVGRMKYAAPRGSPIQAAKRGSFFERRAK